MSCLRLLMLIMKRLPHSRVEFDEIGGIELVQQVLRTAQAAVGYKIADVSDLFCVRVHVQFLRQQIKNFRTSF